MQILADFIVELFLAIGAFIGERLMRRFPVLGKVFFVLFVVFLFGLAATSIWGGHATGASGDESAQSVSPFLYCLGGLLILFAFGRIFKMLAPKRIYKLVSAIVLTVSAAALTGVSVWCFTEQLYAGASMILAMVLVCGVYAALGFKGYIKAKYGE